MDVQMQIAGAIFTKCLLMSVFVVFCMFLVSNTGLLGDENVHIGNERYAEIARFSAWDWDIMPLNTVVNIGYIFVGAYWCRIINISCKQGIFNSTDCSFFTMFNIMACTYGVVSIIRMITQKSVWAIIDRWFTLLFFALVPLWSSHIRDECRVWVCVITMSVSILSYFLTLISSDVYEIIVGCHILRAIYGGWIAYSKHHSRNSVYYFLGALISCSIFVGGNLLDMKLPSFSWLFHYVSGHCISRVFDAAQIYFTNAFFLDLTLMKATHSSICKKDKKN